MVTEVKHRLAQWQSDWCTNQSAAWI